MSSRAAPHAAPAPILATGEGLQRGFFGVFAYSRRALDLVWTTDKALSVWLMALTIVAGILPAGVAYAGALIVDAVVHAAEWHRRTGTMALRPVLMFVSLEAVLVAGVAMAQRGISLAQSLLRAQLGQRVNVMILDKALTLDLTQFEDSEFYDKLTRARREASSRPLSLVMRTFGLMQNVISILSYGGLLVKFSPWAVALLVLAGLPAFLAEAKFSGEAFRLFRWRAPESRMQMYLESVLAREDHAKEVKLFQLGPRLLDRYRDIFSRLYREDRELTVRRDAWGLGLGLLGTAALYGGYGWIAVETVAGAMTLGQMTMYLMLFRQGQAAVSAALSAVGGMYEDNLYLSNLFEFLEQPAGIPVEARDVHQHPQESGVHQVAPLGEEGVEVGAPVLQAGLHAGVAETHVAGLAGDPQPLEEAGEARVVGLVEDDESGVDGEVGRIAGRHPDGVDVAPQPVLGFEQGDLVEGVEQVGADQAGDPAAHDRDAHDFLGWRRRRSAVLGLI